MLSRSERLSLLDREGGELPLKTQAELLSLNRSHLYYKPEPPSERELQIKHAIDRLFPVLWLKADKRCPASAKPNRQSQGCSASHAGNGHRGGLPRPQPQPANQQHKVFPYLLRGMTIDAPNAVWGTDITYIRLARGWLYLVAVLDGYSRYIVSWELSDSLENSFVLSAVERALEVVTPGILNSDQGSQYTSLDYVELVLAAGVRISMDGTGCALDNVFTEPFWRNLKYEEVYLKEYRMPREARQGIGDYVNFYNNERPHQSLGYRTPAEVFHAEARDDTISCYPRANTGRGIGKLKFTPFCVLTMGSTLLRCPSTSFHRPRTMINKFVPKTTLP